MGGQINTAKELVAVVGMEYSPCGRRLFGFFITCDLGVGSMGAGFDWWVLLGTFGERATGGGSGRIEGGGCLM